MGNCCLEKSDPNFIYSDDYISPEERQKVKEELSLTSSDASNLLFNSNNKYKSLRKIEVLAEEEKMTLTTEPTIETNKNKEKIHKIQQSINNIHIDKIIIKKDKKRKIDKSEIENYENKDNDDKNILFDDGDKGVMKEISLDSYYKGLTNFVDLSPISYITPSNFDNLSNPINSLLGSSPRYMPIQIFDPCIIPSNNGFVNDPGYYGFGLGLDEIELFPSYRF